MLWERMTIDEFAQCQRAEGLRLVQVDGVWWVETRPFFFRPLIPFAEIDPRSQKYPLSSCIGGFLHVVPPGVQANSAMNFFVYDNVKGYSIGALSSKTRRSIKIGMQNFAARRIPDCAQFVESAYDVYLSFQRRTNYTYQRRRVKKEVFAQWAKTLYRNDKILKLGAYYKDKLSAVEISYLVDDVIIAETYFANDDSLNMKVTEFILHTLREAAVETNARYLYLGFPSGVKSLDESKRRRGCKLLTMPAYYKINPLSLSVIRVFMKSSYQKLLDIMAPPSQEPLSIPVIQAMSATEKPESFLPDSDLTLVQESAAVAVRVAQEVATNDIRSTS